MTRTKPVAVSVRTVSRLASVPVFLGAGAVLGLAGWLTPDASGHSTHTQLGFDGCTILTLTGWPCPMCGMTTTFSLMAHLRPLEALYNQPFGVVLFLGTVAVAGIAAAEIVAPTDRWRRLWAMILPREGLITAVFLAGLAGGWLWKLFLMWP